jgi:hypothetical protein
MGGGVRFFFIGGAGKGGLRYVVTRYITRYLITLCLHLGAVACLALRPGAVLRRVVDARELDHLGEREAAVGEVFEGGDGQAHPGSP